MSTLNLTPDKALLSWKFPGETSRTKKMQRPTLLIVSQVQLLLLIIIGLSCFSGCGNTTPDVGTTSTPSTSGGENVSRSFQDRSEMKQPKDALPLLNDNTASNSLHSLAPISPQDIPERQPEPVPFDQKIVSVFNTLTTPMDSFEEWERANQTLLNFGEAALPMLSHELIAGDDVARELAASTLVSMEQITEEGKTALRSALKDELPFVRANAAVALVQFPEQRQHAITVLVQLLEHTDSNLQQLAAMNLTSLGKEASPHVVKLTSMLEKKTGEPALLLPVVQLLGRIGPKAEIAIPHLKQIAFEQQGEVSDAATSAIQLIQTTAE